MDVLAWEASPAQSLMARQLQAEEAVNWTAEASAIALDELSGHLSAGYSWAMDVWPHLCTGTSLLAAVYIVISNFLNKDDEQSLLETVFGVAAACTGMASALMLSSIRASEYADDVTSSEGWFCQLQGASVAYFQVRALGRVRWPTDRLTRPCSRSSRPASG